MFPDLFSELAIQHPGAESVFFYEWSGMKFVVDTNSVKRLRPCANFEDTKRAVFDVIADMRPGFLAAVVNSPDDVGHKFGWDSPEYDFWNFCSPCHAGGGLD